jgi:hypothetical protein
VVYRAIIDAQVRSWSNFFIYVAVDLMLVWLRLTQLQNYVLISLGIGLVFAVINSVLLNIQSKSL